MVEFISRDTLRQILEDVKKQTIELKKIEEIKENRESIMSPVHEREIKLPEANINIIKIKL